MCGPETGSGSSDAGQNTGKRLPGDRSSAVPTRKNVNEATEHLSADRGAKISLDFSPSTGNGALNGCGDIVTNSACQKRRIRGYQVYPGSAPDPFAEETKGFSPQPQYSFQAFLNLRHFFLPQDRQGAF